MKCPTPNPHSRSSGYSATAYGDIGHPSIIVDLRPRGPTSGHEVLADNDAIEATHSPPAKHLQLLMMLSSANQMIINRQPAVEDALMTAAQVRLNSSPEQ